MHEVSLLESMLEIIREHAVRHHARRVHRVTLHVGDLSGVVPEALRFAFDVVTHGTIAENADLETVRVPVVCRCLDCQCDFSPPDVVYQCPRCGQLSVDVLQGKELELVSLEVS